VTGEAEWNEAVFPTASEQHPAHYDGAGAEYVSYQIHTVIFCSDRCL